MSKLDENKALVMRLVDEVWSEGNLDVLDEIIADHYKLHHDPGDPWDGQTLTCEGLKDRVQKSRAPFPDQRFTVVHAVAEGDNVVIAWTWDATHQGDIPGFPATGKHVAMSGMTLYPIEDGRITGHWQIADRLTVGQQLMAQKA